MAYPKVTTILDIALAKAVNHLHQSLLDEEMRNVSQRIEMIARNPQNRACVRFVMACALAKVDNPAVDIRKPYTEIGEDDRFSGRTYDEMYLTYFINQHQLPCNTTTAFLTPAFRNRNTILTPTVNLVGRPALVYQATLQLLDDVYQQKITAENLLAETIRWLIIIREEKRQRMESLLAGLKASLGETTLSAESIVQLIEQHLNLKKTSRLPVLVVAAVYTTVGHILQERVLPLHGHNSADKQTGAVGDLEITLIDEAKVITSYEMKTRRITHNDINLALDKIAPHRHPISNYIFITTEPIEPEVATYAAEQYDRTGIEVVILDCIGFLRHFLHLFYRWRMRFLEAYQDLLLAEPESAVNQPLKEAFLALRQAAESNHE